MNQKLNGMPKFTILLILLLVSFIGTTAYATHNNLITGINLDAIDNYYILNEDSDNLMFIQNHTDGKKAIRIIDIRKNG